MASSLLAVPEDIDDLILGYCKNNPRIEPPAVVRDIARIVCIAHLVQNGTLDGRNAVLSGGMAMRCLSSPRLSIWDGDTSARRAPDLDVLRDAISYEDDDIAVTPAPTRTWETGYRLVTAQPITYEPFFTRLDAGQAEFSLTVSHRGIAMKTERHLLRTGYPFPILAEELEVPIMNPDEILAEKTVAWWLFGHAKHYNDIAFLLTRMVFDDRRDEDASVRSKIRRTIERKIEVNKALHKNRIKALTVAERRRRLEDPNSFVDERRTFNSLSYLHGTPPNLALLRRQVSRYGLPLLFDE
jgi:hypothetical protein